jgi:hypothetical protein
VVASHGLHHFRQVAQLRPILFIRGRDDQFQLLHERVYGEMDLRSLAPLVAIAAGRSAAQGTPCSTS